jgi:hypothetical protein
MPPKKLSATKKLSTKKPQAKKPAVVKAAPKAAPKAKAKSKSKAKLLSPKKVSFKVKSQKTPEKRSRGGAIEQLDLLVRQWTP